MKNHGPIIPCYPNKGNKHGYHSLGVGRAGNWGIDTMMGRLILEHLRVGQGHPWLLYRE